MIHLGVFDPAAASAAALERGLAPVTVGVPIPQAAELRDLDRVVLVGAEAAQFHTMARWPDGSARWLLVDALVPLAPGQSKAAMHLTTGQPAPPVPDLAEDNGSEIRVDTGRVAFTVPKQGPGLLQVPMSSGSDPSSANAGSVRVAVGTADGFEMSRVAATIERNGPALAVIVVEEALISPAGRGLLTSRVVVARGQSQLKIETALHLPAATTNSLAVPAVRMLFTGLSSSIPELASAAIASWREVRFAAGTNALLVCFSDRDAGASRLAGMPEGGVALDVVPTLRGAMALRPASLLRRELFLDLRPDGSSVLRAAHPVWGKAVLPDAYNDAGTLVEKVVPRGEPVLQKPVPDAVSFRSIEAALYEFLGMTNVAQMTGLAGVSHQLDTLLANGELGRALPGEALSLWSFLSGDAAVRGVYLDWGRTYEAAVRAIKPRRDTIAGVLAQLLDLYRVTETESTRDYVLGELKFLIARVRTTEREAIDVSGPSEGHLLASISSVIRQTGGDAELEDQLLDGLEELVHRCVARGPTSGRVFAEGYIATGDAAFLAAGANWLAGQGAGTVDATLQHALAAPQRQYVWRELPLRVRRGAGGTPQLAWTVPERGERIRIKHADRPIEFAGSSSANDKVAFFRARNLTGEPRLAAAGEEQVMRVGAEAGLAGQHFAARYLERGVGLPAPARTGTTGAGHAPTDENTERAAEFALGGAAMVALAIAALVVGAVALVWRKRRPAVTSLWVAAFATALALMSGCSQGPENPQPRLGASREALTDRGSFKVAYTPRPEPIPLNEHFALEVAVTPVRSADGEGELSVVVDADMPAHGHGMNTAPRVTSLGGNRYQVEGMLFHMPGDWVLLVDVARGVSKERVVFPLQIK